MKKIGIVTVHRAVNFGAVLQMYALYNTIKKLGGDPYIVDYRAKVIEDRENYIKNLFSYIQGKNGLIKKIFFFVDYLFSLPFNYKKKRVFRSFLQEHFKLSNVYYKDDIVEANSFFDLFIAGSDQIWNRKLNDDDVYFLSFADNEKKYSYAASFGNYEGYETKKERNLSLLKDFSSISVREDIGKDDIEKNLNISISKNIDPVLLMNKNDWDEIVHFPKDLDESTDYIVLYWATRQMKKKAIQLAQKNRWEIYDINEGIVRGNMRNLRALSPGEFLGVIRNARYVFTTSFHGMVFSIIFHIPFKVEYNFMGYTSNIRQKDILDLIGIVGVASEQGTYLDNINWDYCDLIFEQQREKGKQYLKKCIGDY